MRKIGIVAAVVFVASWMFSLLCMHAAGQAGWKMEEENQNVISESVVYENNQKGSEETAGWNGNSHSVDQGDGEAYSRRIILERYGVFRWKIIFRALWSARPVRKWGWKR